MNAKLIFVLILTGFAVLFILQNVAAVEIQFLFWSMQMSRALLMFLILTIGIVIGWFLLEAQVSSTASSHLVLWRALLIEGR